MTAMYIKIQKDISNKIQTGTYPVGDTIPNEIDLAKAYGVSRPTIRQAIQPLVDQGLLERRKKRGTIVCPPKIDQGFTQKIDSFNTEMVRKGHSIQTKVLTFQKETASEEIQAILRCSTVFKLVRLRYVDYTPNVFVTTYMPYELFKDLKSVNFETESFYGQCAKYGHPISSIRRHLEITKADETLADLLQIEQNEPLFYFHSYGFDPQQTPIEYSISKYRGDTNAFSFTLSQ